MRRKFLPKIRFGVFVSMMVLIANLSKADLVGAEMGYELLNDSVLVTVTAYDNYHGQTNVSPYVQMRHASGSLYTSGVLKLVSKSDETPTCSGGCSNFSSSSCGNDYTLVKLVYQTTFSFESYGSGECDMVLTWQSCCRPHTSRSYYLQTSFNRCLENGNTSPAFSSSPLVIANQNQHYSNSWAAVDTDGDSLKYELVPALTYNGEFYNYDKGLDHTMPLQFLGFPGKTSQKFPRGFHLNEKTGLLRFFPTTESSAPIVVKVSEFRGGVKIGEVLRDMTFVVEKVANRKPVMAGINGTGKEVVSACIGQELCFTITPKDFDSKDKLKLSWSTDAPGASVSKTSSTRPKLKFCWTPKGKDLARGTFRLHLKVEDDACDLKGVYEKTITINVKRPFEASFVSKISGCEEGTFNSFVRGAENSDLGYNWTIADENFSGKNLVLPFEAGVTKAVTLTITDQKTGCQDEFISSFSVPAKPIAEAPDNVFKCSESAVLLEASGGLSYKWFDQDGRVVSTDPVFETNTLTPSSFIVQVADVHGCTDRDTVQVNINESEIAVAPVVGADERDPIVCSGSTIEFKAFGSQTNYVWSNDGLTETTDMNKATYSFKTPSAVSVSGTDKNGCYGVVSIPVAVDNDCVWPGDIDGDQQVNNIDVLYIGLGYNERYGIEQRTLDTEWKAFHTENWDGEFQQSTGTRNHKHADTNGDGVINFLDLNAIDVFYHNEYKTNKKKNEKGAKLTFDYNIDSVKKGKKIFEVSVNLGDADNIAKDVYGLAFSIDYDFTVISSSIEFSTENSWITKGSNKIQLVKNIPEYSAQNPKEIVGGKIDVAVSRTDKIAVSGKGKVGILKFVIDDDIDWKNSGNIILNFQGVHLIDNAGKPQDAYGVGSTIQFDRTSSIDPVAFRNSIDLYPNPSSNGQLTLSIAGGADNMTATILSVTGQEIKSISNLTNGSNLIDVSELQGCYLIHVIAESGLSKSIPVIIE